MRCELKESVNRTFCVNVHDTCVNYAICAFSSDCMTDRNIMACVCVCVFILFVPVINLCVASIDKKSCE